MKSYWVAQGNQFRVNGVNFEYCSGDSKKIDLVQIWKSLVCYTKMFRQSFVGIWLLETYKSLSGQGQICILGGSDM